MEFTQHEDSKTSSEESDKQELVNDDVGIGRSYECVFCKRGFTTAQALGGHMNIHRRDRARNKQPASPSILMNQPVDEYARPGFLQSISSQSSFYSPAMETHKNYQMYLPRPISSTTAHQHRHYSGDESFLQRPPHFSLFEDNWSTNLSLRIGPTYIEDTQEAKKQASKEDELDLELRLGHDP